MAVHHSQVQSNPATRQSRSRIFRNQEELINSRVEIDLPPAMKGADAVVFDVHHAPYLEIAPDEAVGMAGGPLAVTVVSRVFRTLGFRYGPSS